MYTLLEFLDHNEIKTTAMQRAKIGMKLSTMYKGTRLHKAENQYLARWYSADFFDDHDVMDVIIKGLAP